MIDSITSKSTNPVYLQMLQQYIKDVFINENGKPNYVYSDPVADEEDAALKVMQARLGDI